MNRPYIFCHMLTSIDGKIMGAYMESPEGRIAGDVFNEISLGKNSDYAPQALLCGRITTDDNFTCYHKPELDDNAPTVPAGDYIVKKEMPYYVAVDTSGKLGWESDRIEYSGVSLSVLEVLTEKTSNSYKAFLRRLNIPYIIAGENELDHKLVMEKLNTLFGIQTLMLGGGGVVNWSFIQAGMCDELSVVIAAAADGSSETPSLFETRGVSSDKSVGFSLMSVEAKEGGCVWLRYKVNETEKK